MKVNSTRWRRLKELLGTEGVLEYSPGESGLACASTPTPPKNSYRELSNSEIIAIKGYYLRIPGRKSERDLSSSLSSFRQNYA